MSKIYTYKSYRECKNLITYFNQYASNTVLESIILLITVINKVAQLKIKMREWIAVPLTRIR